MLFHNKERRFIMQKQIVIWVFALSLIAVMAASPATPKWVLKADYIDACSCDLACPCIFGGSPRTDIAKERRWWRSRKDIMVRSISPE